MTDEKLQDWLDYYDNILANVTGFDTEINHLRTMIPTMRMFLKEGRREKLMRWIGFVQGALWAKHYYTIDQLKDHNKPE